jgi:hypothetical protein
LADWRKESVTKTRPKPETENEAEWQCQVISLPFRHAAQTASSLNPVLSVTGTDFAEHFRQKQWAGFTVG